MTRIARGTLEQLSVEHDAASHPRRHDHGHEVLDPARDAQPSFGEREGLGIAVPEDG